MKLTVLTENVAGAGFLAEHGLSYLIEVDGKVILFDTGHTDVFLKNGKQLGINLPDKIDIIVLSHGHWDHGDGLRFIRNKTLITHPGVFMKRYRKKNFSEIGLQLSKDDIADKFNLITSTKPFKIADNIIFLGEIPRSNDFEAQTTSFVDENDNPDFVPDDSALVVTENNKLTVVTGCSHAGICNIISYAIQVTGIQKVKTAIGGFHLKHNNRQTQQTIDFFKELAIEQIYPSHCTEFEALAAFSREFAISQIKTGMVLEL